MDMMHNPQFDQDVWAPLAVALVSMVLFIALLLVRFMKGPDATLRTWLIASGVISIALLAEAGINRWAPYRARWRWDLALFPAALVGIQGLSVYRARRFTGVGSGPLPLHANLAHEDPNMIAEIVKQLHDSTERHFGAAPLFLRFGVPAFFIASFGIGESNALLREINVFIPNAATLWGDIHRNPPATSPFDLPWPPQVLIGAAYGLVGAYLFVVLQLGYRSLQQDITPGSAAWCAATLAVGPLVAGTIAVTGPPLWPSSQNVEFSRVALYVMAGFSPRYAVGLIETLARRLMPGAPATATSARVVPVNQVRGISDEIANRLAEEGITNVTAMARSNPIRLLRNTRFDKRQILAWIDCALLMDSLPEQWAALERVGITTATGLRWYSSAGDTPGENRSDRLSDLAKVAGVDQNVVSAASDRLAHDPQVLTVLVLNEYEESDGDEPVAHVVAPPNADVRGAHIGDEIDAPTKQ